MSLDLRMFYSAFHVLQHFYQFLVKKRLQCSHDLYYLMFICFKFYFKWS